jgi:hypothetical protein
MISITPIHYRLGANWINQDDLNQANLEKLLHGA